MSTCLYCEQPKKLCRAHIVPKGFNFPRVSGESSPILVSNKPSFHIRRSQSGVYDKNILCAECDQGFGRLDEYAKSALLETSTVKTHSLGAKPVIFEYPDCDPEKLCRFVLSVLWRGAISTQEFYKRINLGSYEGDFLRYLKREIPLPKHVSVAMTEFVNTARVGGRVPQLAPHATRHDGVRFWHLYANRFCFYVRTDQKSHEKYSKFTLSEDAPVLSLARDFETSREFQAMRKVAWAQP